MRVALFGGTGFVGSHIIDALVEAQLTPVVLVRPGSASRLRHADRCIAVSGDVTDADAVQQAVKQADAVIYNIGILREFPQRGITFDALQHEAVCRIVAAAQRHGAKRFLLMSANGVERGGTGYQRSKRLGEECLQRSALDWTIVRPSVIFGDPRGRMEFATQLKRDIVDSPLPAPLFYSGLLPSSAGAFTMSPVHVRDVARAFVTALQWPTTVGQVLRLGGPAAISWRQILDTIATACGTRKWMLPVPAFGVSTAARLLDRFESFPLTRDQITMLMEGNACPSDALLRLGIQPTPFSAEHLGYLNRPHHEDRTWQRNAA